MVNWEAVGAIGQAVGAIATFAAVVVALSAQGQHRREWRRRSDILAKTRATASTMLTVRA